MSSHPNLLSPLVSSQHLYPISTIPHPIPIISPPSPHPSSNPSNSTFNHHLPKRRFIGHQCPLTTQHDLIRFILPIDTSNHTPLSSLQTKPDLNPRGLRKRQLAPQPSQSAHKSHSASAANLDNLTLPRKKHTQPLGTKPPTRRPSLLSIRSLISLNPPTSAKTWSGSHFEIGADIEQISQQASFLDPVTHSLTSSQHAHSGRRHSHRLDHRSNPGTENIPPDYQPDNSEPQTILASSSLLAPPNRTISARLSPSPQPVFRRHSQPSLTTPTSSSPVLKSLPPHLTPPSESPFSPPTVLFCQSSAFTSTQPLITRPDPDQRKPSTHYQLLCDDDTEADEKTPEFPIPSNSDPQANMLVKWEWLDQQSIKPRTGADYRRAEVPFKPYKVVLNDYSLDIYEYSKGLFKHRHYTWKLVYSIRLIKGETVFTRPLPSELSFCLSVKLKPDQSRGFYQPSSWNRTHDGGQSTSLFSCLMPLKPNSSDKLNLRSQQYSRATLTEAKAPTRVAKFVFIASSQSAAGMMAYQVWQRLGGSLPKDILVEVIGISSRLRVPIKPFWDQVPSSAEELKRETLKTFERDEHQAEVYEHIVSKVQDLRLCWRNHDRIDWILPTMTSDLNSNTAQTDPRMSSTFRGLTFPMLKDRSVLELRPALHYPNCVKLESGEVCEEPAGLEGFVSCFGPVCQAGERVYLSSFDGVLLMCKPSLAMLPRAPMSAEERERLIQVKNNHFHHTPIDVRWADSTHRFSTDNLRSSAASRLNLLPSLREEAPSQPHSPSGLSTRHQGSPTPPQPSSPLTPTQDQPHIAQPLLARFYRHESERSHKMVKNSHLLIYLKDITSVKPMTFDRRSRNQNSTFESKSELASIFTGFQLCFGTDRTMRFEAASTAEAAQWIEHLTHLSTYWKLRHKEDVRVEMMAQYGRCRPMPLPMYDGEVTHHHALNAARAEQTKTAMLSSLYHMCIVEGCRTITRLGRLRKKSYRGEVWYTREVVLSGGELIEFEAIDESLFGNHSKPIGCFRKVRSFGLSMSFVCTGLALAEQLPGGETVPGIYEDGMRTRDSASSCVFVVWAGVGRRGSASQNVNQSIRMYQAKSQLERDLWIHAIQFEIERAIGFRQSS